MADNAQLNGVVTPGGLWIATDEIPGSPATHAQVIKIADGRSSSLLMVPADDTFGLFVQTTRTPTASGANASSPVPVEATGVSADGSSLIVSNTARKRIEIISASDTEEVFVKLVGTAPSPTVSATNYHIRLEPSQSWWDDIYTGALIACHGGTSGTQPVAVIELT